MFYAPALTASGSFLSHFEWDFTCSCFLRGPGLRLKVAVKDALDDVAAAAAVFLGFVFHSFDCAFSQCDAYAIFAFIRVFHVKIKLQTLKEALRRFNNCCEDFSTQLF